MLDVARRNDGAEVFLNGTRVSDMTVQANQTEGWVEMYLCGHARMLPHRKISYTITTDSVGGNNPIIVRVSGEVLIYRFPQDNNKFMQDLAGGRIRKLVPEDIGNGSTVIQYGNSDSH